MNSNLLGRVLGFPGGGRVAVSALTTLGIALGCGAGGNAAPNASSASGICSGHSPALSADRQTVWQPGVTYNGGIPARTTTCAKLSPKGPGQDDTAAINTALKACPPEQTVSLAAGTYTISGQGIQIPSHVTLRGTVDSTGRPATKLVKTDGDSQPYVVISVGNLYDVLKFKTPPTKTDPATGGTLFASDGQKETNQVTLVKNPGLQPGELVYVDMASDPKLTWWNLMRSPGGGQTADPSRGWFSNYDRPINQVLEVKSVSGNTVTFTTNLHITFSVADGAALWQLDNPATKWAGVEDLYVFGGAGGDGGGGIHFFSAMYSWARNVEVDHTLGTGVNIDGSFRCEVRDSYIHHAGPWTGPNPGGGAYLTGFNSGTSDSLLENSVVWNGNKVIVMRASGGGNVVGYNYMQDAWGSQYPSEPETGINASHMTTPHYELIEGNESFAFGSDPVWGNSIYITVLRNNFTALRIAQAPLSGYSCTQCAACPLFYEDIQVRLAVYLSTNDDYFSFLGNVLGYQGQGLVHQRSGTCIGQGTGFEYDYANDNKIPMWSLDPSVNATVLRDGNFDWVTQKQRWASSPGTVPNSLYLCSAPAFFGSNAWPWVHPENGSVSTLPAKARWQAMVADGSYLSDLDKQNGGL